MPDNDTLAGELVRRTESMKSARGLFDYHWQEVRDNVIPVLQRFVGKDPTGAKSNQFTVDETPEQANELLASALHGMISNPALKWFDLSPQDPRLKDNDQVAAWLAHARDVMFDVMYAPAAGLTAAHHETYLNLTTFGTGALFTTERLGGGLLFQSRPLQEIYVAEGEDGRVDTVHRWYQMTARQAVAKWQDRAGPKALEKSANATRQDDPLTFLHAVYPRGDRALGGLSGARMPWASVYVAVDDKMTIREGGYREMPGAVPRWIKRSGEIWGRGPGTKALPSCKALQRAMKVTLRGAETAIAPPLLAADDGVLSPIRMHPNGITYARAELMARGEMPVKPLITGAKPELGEEMMKGMRERIQASFYNHLLQMMRDPRMTATQVIQIAEETLRILGPVIGRLQAELLGPQIERVFGMLLRAGAFAPAPAALHGAGVLVEYVSPIAQAQKLAEAKGIVQTFGVVTQMAQVNPEVMDNFDLDGASRALAVMFGMPRYLLRDPRAIADIRAKRAQAEQQQNTVNNLRLAAGGIKDAASALPALRQGLGFSPDQGEDTRLAA